MWLLNNIVFCFREKVFLRRSRDAGRSLISTHLQSHLDARFTLGCRCILFHAHSAKTCRRAEGQARNTKGSEKIVRYISISDAQWKYDAARCAAPALLMWWWIYQNLHDGFMINSGVRTPEIRMDNQKVLDVRWKFLNSFHTRFTSYRLCFVMLRETNLAMMKEERESLLLFQVLLVGK